MGVQNPNSTDYVHSDEPNLLNIHKAMQYRNDGTPELRVNSTFEGNIVISGNVNIPGVVEVESSHDHPVHTHTDELGNIDLSNTWMPVQGNVVVSGGNITVQQGTTPWVTTGNANVTVIGNIAGITTLPAIRGNVNVDNFPSNVNITSMPAVTGNVGVSGNVSITQLPALGNVSITQMPAITGNVTANVTFPNVYPVSANTSVNSLDNPISIQITKNGLAVSDTVGLPTRVINDEALISYARGKPVTEADVLNAYLIDKSGATETLGTTPATMSTVWGGTGLYPWTTFTGTGDKIYIKSVTNDPKVQGKSVTIEGLDSNYDILIETVTLHASNTMIAVSTVNNFYRTNKMYLTGNNTNNLPHDYDIELRYGSSSGTIIGKMNAPWGRGQNCFYTVPRGHEAFVLSINGNSGKMDEITSSLWFHPYGGTWTLQKSFKFISGTFDHNFRTPLRIPEKSDVEIRAFALVESSRIGTEFQMLVLPKA